MVMTTTRRALALAILLAGGPAAAHDAPSGWAYPVSCCSAADCRPRACDALESLLDGGVLDTEYGQTFQRTQVRPSQDSQCHVCTGGGDPKGRPICVFLVQSF